MRIAVASGKGGTGKTFVSTNLANVASKTATVGLYDLDVDEPNCHLFFDPESEAVETITMMIPSVDKDKCNGCGVCSEVCEFNAIVTLPGDVLVFAELCHSCYACAELCPQGALGEGTKEIGTVGVSQIGSLFLVTGRLAIGQPATTALVRETKRRKVPGADLILFDSPPGTTCPVIEAVKDVDYIVLVGEPTRFGIHDLDLMVKTIRQLDRPFGVVVNKAVDGYPLVEDYCAANGIEIVLSIPEKAEIASAYSRGELVTETMPVMENLFLRAMENIREAVREVKV